MEPLSGEGGLWACVASRAVRRAARVTAPLFVGVPLMLGTQGFAQTGGRTPGVVVGWGYQAMPYVAPGTRFTAIAAGGDHSLALKSDGTVVAWGRNDFGESTVPTGLGGVVAVAAGGSHSLALKSDGTVVAWGWDGVGQSTVPAGLSGVVAVAAGDAHSLALKGDGTVAAWGSNGSAESTVPAGLSGVVAVAAGGYQSLALKSDGTVVAWGLVLYGESTVPAGLNGVVAVAAGDWHSLALKSDGTVVAWGDNHFGQSTVPTGLSGVVAVAAGGDHSLALKSDGTVVTWGDNWLFTISTVPAGLGGVVAVAAGHHHSLALETDGTVVYWCDNECGQSTVPAGLSGVVAVAAGDWHSLALKSDGTVVAWSWGDNEYGQSTVPAGLSGVVAVAAGDYHSLAVKSDGTVVSWGDNEYGQSTVPTGLSGVVAVAAGGDHSLALKSDGTVVSWGDNEYGQSTVPTGLSGVVAVAAGGDHSLALKSDGTVAAWGSNGLGESTVPAGLSGVVAVAAGEDHDLAIVGQPQGLAVVPDGATVFGSIQVGSGAERGFTVSNPGDSTLSGTASVSEPFSVIAGASYTLGPGRSQTVTVRYSPTVPGTDSGYVTFTGGGLTLTRQVIGSAFNDPTPLTGAIAGRVTSSGQPISGATITVIVPGANLFGPGAISGQAGSYLVTGLAPHAHYEVMAAPPMGQLQQFYMADVANVAVTAGQTTTVNIELTPVNNQPPAPTAQNTPVILVRGWGPDTPWHDNDPNSEWGYWSALRSALRGFENVWDCNQPDNDQDFPVYNGLGGVINGENGIGDNARSLEYFVQQKALQFKRVHHSFPQSINIVAHSMGGLIAREAISLTGAGVFTVYDPADQEISTIKVNKVVMLGTPNAGSVLADAGEYFLGGLPFWLPSWTSTKNLRTDFVQSCFNAIYNSFPSSVSLYLVGGGGGPSSANDLYAAYSRFMNVQNAPLPPEQVTDGMVTWPSLQGTFYKRTLPTFEVQQFVSVPLYPAAPPKFFSLLDHSELKSDLLAVDWVIARLTDAAEPSVVSPSIAGDVGGPRAKSPRPLDLTQDPPIEQFELATGTLGLGATAKNVVICDAATAVQFQMIADDTNAMLRLNTPSGAEISPATPQTNTNVQYSAVASTSGVVVATYKVSNPAHGAWTAVIDDSGVTSTQATYGLMVFGDSSVAMVPQTGSVFNEGQDAVISCALVDLSTHPPTPVSSASMGATILFPDGSTNRLVLLDDGAHNDGALGDGVFAAVLAGVQQPGQYSISYRALGTNSQGQALQRVAAGAFTVSSGHGSLWGDPVYQSLDTDGDGIADFLEVKCWVNLTAPGNYILAGDLVDDSGAHRFSQSAAFAVDASGPSMATLIFNLAEMRVAGGQGTYHIENLQLFEATSTGIAWVDAYHGSSVVNIQAAKAINVSPQNLATNVSPAVELRWADGGASSSYDVYFGTNAPGLSLKTNQTSTTYGPGILAYNTAYYWRVDARNAAGVTTGDVWTFATVPAAVQGAGLGVRTNCFGFTIAGSSNLVIVVEACTNLAKPIWSPVGTNTLSGGLSYFRDPQWTNYPSRFYRLRSP